ncbi:hypothetical protein EYF80_006172 [Liparis tanakae]|uniref:Uncharacterized protein n=1 Tax=Liparis tanakae TaxID=230148 RepID=A0A4Z2J1H0_9TELE|nr:hypothetical protein EYF80_006172 [Liparis tanakae]
MYPLVPPVVLAQSAGPLLTPAYGPRQTSSLLPVLHRLALSCRPTSAYQRHGRPGETRTEG